MDISIKHLAAFLSVAEHGNFTRASVALAMSQPSLTAVIKQLEAAAGVQLFDRTTRRVLLTRAERAFVPKAGRLGARIRQGDHAASGDRHSQEWLCSRRQRTGVRRPRSSQGPQGVLARVLRGLPSTSAKRTKPR